MKQTRFARWTRFTVAGAAGFAIQIAMLAALTLAGLHYLLATAIAVEIAIVCNFVWHERWTWRDRLAPSMRDRWTRLLRFNALTAVTSIAGSVVLTAVFVEAAGLSPIAANIASVVALGLLNFAGAEHIVFRSAAAIVFASMASTAHADTLAATLSPTTAKDFTRYAAAVEARSMRELDRNEPYMDIDRLRRGEILVTRGVACDEIPIDGGTINHWRGTVFVPKVNLDVLLKVLQEPQTNQHKQEDVLSSRVVARGADSQKIYLRLRRTSFVTAVYDTEYDVEYRRLAPDRALSNSISTRIVEIENAGTPRERALPEGNDRGFMWRLNSYWRYQQVDGGVLVEIESLTLSRSLPPIVGPLIRPLITSTARESMTRTLASVRARFSS